MSSISFTSRYLTKDNEPWFPIMGEIHYSRYPRAFWDESLQKMKAGGVNVVSTYVIWIHHEEVEGEYDFVDNKDLHEFVSLCKQNDLSVLLRIGPWSHGEVRNGGFPDWLLHKGFNCRTNDPKYLSCVENWYIKIYEQIKDLMDSGTIIGIQIENEYGHCGGLTGADGETHIKNLTNIARRIGFKAPLFTATGWGGAVTGGLLPVMGGYCDAPWDERICEIEPSGNYVFTYERNDHNIGSDFGLGTGITFDINKFPYLTAELGGGLQPTHHRRTIATAQDIGAMSLVKLGSGVNCLGYYMYHGGTNPDGKLSSLQESIATGSLNDLPEKNYDFRAPIREYGQMSETLLELKLLTMFINDFGSDLCTMSADIPSDNPLQPSNTKSVRYSFRYNGTSGYLFVNNYVRHARMVSHVNTVFQFTMKNKDNNQQQILFPPLNICNNDYFFFPFNFTAGTYFIKTAKVTPLCFLDDKKCKTYVFYCRNDETDFSCLFDFENPTNSDVNNSISDCGVACGTNILVLSRHDALHSWKTQDNHLIITNGSVVDNLLYCRDEADVFVYPPLSLTPAVFEQDESSLKLLNKNLSKQTKPVLFAHYKEKHNRPSLSGQVKVTQSSIVNSLSPSEYKVDLSDLANNLKHACVIESNNQARTLSDCFVRFYYTGDSAKLFANIQNKRTLIADHFYLGEDFPWEIGLKRFTKIEGFDFTTLELVIEPLHKNSFVYLEKWPNMENDYSCTLVKTDFSYEWVINYC